MTFLVTGAAGFIGSNLVDKLLLNADNTVIGIDNFDPFYHKEQKLDNIHDALKNPRFHFIEADIRDVNLKQQLEGHHIDAIIHLAAKAGVRPSIEKPAEYIDVNISGTQNLLDFAIKANIQQFVFASSSSVYGVNKNYPWSEEETELQFISPYAYTKISCEQMGRMYSHLYPIRFIALRFFTVFGPRQRPDLAIHKFFKSIQSNKPVEVYGDGSALRDFTYVDDIVNAVIAATTYTEKPFDVFNVGNNVPISVNDLIALIEQVAGKKALVNYLPPVMGDVPVTYANINKANEHLLYNPSISMKQGLQNFFSWFMSKNS